MWLMLFVHVITDNKTNNVSNQIQKCLNGCGKEAIRCHRKKGLKKMKFNFLQKQTSRRQMLRNSATLAGSAFLAHLLPATLLHASAASYAQQEHRVRNIVLVHGAWADGSGWKGVYDILVKD